MDIKACYKLRELRTIIIPPIFPTIGIYHKLTINKLFLRLTIESILGSNDFGGKDVKISNGGITFLLSKNWYRSYM